LKINKAVFGNNPPACVVESSPALYSAGFLCTQRNLAFSAAEKAFFHSYFSPVPWTS